MQGGKQKYSDRRSEIQKDINMKEGNTFPSRTELLKIHKMLYSHDPEINELGLQALKGTILRYDHYITLKGISFKSNPFFPYRLRIPIKKWKNELIRTRYKHLKTNKHGGIKE